MNGICYVQTIGLMMCAMVSFAQQPKMVVTVEKFENEANAPTEFFNSLRTRITDNIVNTRKFEVVERQRLASVLSERKLVDAGMTEENETTPQAGKLKAAGFILYGSVLSLGLDKTQSDVVGLSAAKGTAKVEIQLRFANAESGKIISSKTVIATKSQSRMEGDGQQVTGNVGEQVVQDAIREAAKKVTEALVDLAYPTKILKLNPSDMLVNLTKEQTEIGAVYEVFSAGEEIKDPDTGESLGASEELVGKVEVARTSPKFSFVVPVSPAEIAAFKVGMLVRRQDEEAAKQEKVKARKEAVKTFESRF
jgi:curli biogenesis system outer membrane secretion channel CsgG